MVGGGTTEPTMGQSTAPKREELDLETINRRALNEGLVRNKLIQQMPALKRFETMPDLEGLSLTGYNYPAGGIMMLNYEATAAQGTYEDMRGRLIRHMECVVQDDIDLPLRGTIPADQERYRICLYDSQVQVFLKVFEPTTKR